MNNKQKVYQKRLDFYWQALIIYLSILIAYSLFSGLLNTRSFAFKFDDPIVMLFGIFVLASGLSFSFSLLQNKKILIDENSITITTRLNETVIPLDSITRIIITNKRKLQNRQSKQMIIIRFNLRRRPLRFRPSSYWDDKDLLNEIISIKNKLPKSNA